MGLESGEIIIVVIIWIIVITVVTLLFSFSKEKIKTTVSEKKKLNEKGGDMYQIIAVE